jgi:hypothetical protein
VFTLAIRILTSLRLAMFQKLRGKNRRIRERNKVGISLY